MVQVSGNFGSLVDIDPVLDDLFFNAYNQPSDIIPLLFGMRTSGKAVETDQLIGSFGDPEILSASGTVPYDTAEADYSVTYTPIEYVKGFQVERKMHDDLQYEGIFDRAENLGLSFARWRQKDAMSVFNNAFTAGTTAGYDTDSLCSTSHNRSETDTTSVSNSLTLALNSTNLETAITTLEGLGDDKGEEITLMPNILLVPRALRKTALELTESELTPESGNNAINVHEGMATIMSPYLSDTNAWFVIDGVMAQRWLKWYTRIPTEFAAEDSFDTLIRKYRAYMRYSRNWSNFRFVVGSNPS